MPRTDKAERRRKHEELLAEAEKSPKDEFTGNVRCLSCGKALNGYPELAQHLHSRHSGINSPDARFIEYQRRKSQGKKAPFPTRDTFTFGDLLTAALDTIELRRRSGSAEKNVQSPSKGVRREESNRQIQKSSPNKSERARETRVTNGLRYTNSQGRQRPKNVKVQQKEEGEMLDKEEVRRLEAAVGLKLRRTKNVSRATRKRITTRKIHVLTARVATSRKLLHALQCELDERRNDLGELMNEEMQDGSGGGHKDDADLSRAKLETQVSALQLAIEEVKKTLHDVTTKWREKLPGKRVLFEELLMSEDLTAVQTAGNYFPTDNSPICDTTCSGELLEAYKELDSQIRISDDDMGMEDCASDHFSCHESPATACPKASAAQTTTPQQFEEVSQHQKVTAARCMGSSDGYQSSSTSSEESDTLDALSCWAKAAGVQKLYLQEVRQPKSSAEADCRCHLDVKSGFHEPVLKVTGSTVAPIDDVLNVAPCSPVMEGSNFLWNKEQNKQDSCPSLHESASESSDDDSLGLGFCDVLSSWAAATHASEVCKSTKTQECGSNESFQSAGGNKDYELEDVGNQGSRIAMTVYGDGCQAELSNEGSKDNAEFCHVLSSRASSATSRNVTTVSPVQLDNSSTNGPGSQKADLITTNDSRKSGDMPCSGWKAKTSWIRILKRSEIPDQHRISSVCEQHVEQTPEKPQVLHPSRALAVQMKKGSQNTSLVVDDRTSLRTSVSCAFLRSRDHAEMENGKKIHVSISQECDEANSRFAAGQHNSVSQFLNTKSDTGMAAVPTGPNEATGIGDHRTCGLMTGPESRMVDGRRRKRKKKRKGNTGSPESSAEKVESVRQSDTAHDSTECALFCEQCHVGCATREDFIAHIRCKKHLERSSRAILHEQQCNAKGGAKIVESLVAEGPLARLPPRPGPSKAVDDAVKALLTRLNELQRNSLLQHANNKHKAHRWLTNGMREVQQAIKHRRVKAVIAAPNVEHPLDHTLDQLLQLAESEAIPVIQALSRRKLGAVFHFRKKMSVVAILDWQGAREEFTRLLEEMQNVKEQMMQDC